MEFDFFLLVFAIIVCMVTIFFPVSGFFEIRKLKRRISEGDSSIKIKFYHSNIFWSWIPIVIIIIMLPITGISIGSIGIKWINFETHSISKWLVFTTIALYFLYLFYNIYSIISFKRNKESRLKVAKSIPADYRSFLPVTQKEKRVWSLVSVSAGISEELLYRGYFFYALAVVFPGLSLIHILFITTLIFGVGHLYLGKEVIKSTFLGLVFGLFFIVFDSVIPVMIIHIVQDLVVRDILDEENDDVVYTATNNG